jgi:hypothetical protein
MSHEDLLGLRSHAFERATDVDARHVRVRFGIDDLARNVQRAWVKFQPAVAFRRTRQ